MFLYARCSYTITISITMTISMTMATSITMIMAISITTYFIRTWSRSEFASPLTEQVKEPQSADESVREYPEKILSI